MISSRSASGGSEARRTAASKLSHTKWAWSGTVLWKDKQPIELNGAGPYPEKHWNTDNKTQIICVEFTYNSVLLSTACRILGNGNMESGLETQHCFPHTIMFILPKGDRNNGTKVMQVRKHWWHEVEATSDTCSITWSRHPGHSVQEILELRPEKRHFNQRMQKPFDC